MSIDCAIVNLDRHEFLRPMDLGLRSEIRSIENAPGLFHAVMARMLASGDWVGCRVAIITDASGPFLPPQNLPSWDTVMSRHHGWSNILAPVVADLVARHSSSLDLLYGGKVESLIKVLGEHIDDLVETLQEFKQDATEQYPVDPVEQMGMTRELERAREILSQLSSGWTSSATTHESGPT